MSSASPRRLARRLLATLTTLVAVITLLAPATPALAAPILVLNVELAPGTTTPIDTGKPFRYRLTYECSGSLSTDICTNMLVTTAPLPTNLEGIQVLGNADVTLANFNPSTRVATWQFKSPLAPGTTGQLEFEVQFAPGTTLDGDTTAITTTISADGLTPVTTSSPTVPANATDETTATKSLESGGASGDTATYRISVCAGDEGALDFENVTVVDTLPAGAVYVSSSPPATSVVGSTITWSGIARVAANSCNPYRVTVSYPAGTNPIGASRTNSASVTGTPHGGVERTITTDITHPIAGPNPGISLDKSADVDTIIGGTVVTTLNVRNSGNVGLQATVVEDIIPNEHDLTSIDTGPATTVEYQKNGGAIWTSGVALGSNIAVNGTNFPGLIAGDYVSALRFNIGTIAIGYDNSSIRLRSTIINPAHGGASYTLPRNVTNTAVARATYQGVPVTDSVDGATTEVSIPKARPTPQKSIVSGSPALPGDTVRYRLSMNNGSFRQLDEPVVADLLPASLTYQAGSWAYAPIASCPASPAFQSIANYGGSGRTLLVWSWAGTGCAVPSGSSVGITFDVKVNQGTYPTSALPNQFALVNYSTDPSEVRVSSCAAAPSEASFFSTNAGTGVDASKLCWSPPTNLRVNAAASIASAKQVRGQLDAGFHRDPKVGATVQGGLITYSMALTNTGNVDFQGLQIVDILPYKLPAPGNVGVRDLAPLGSEWSPQLAGPVEINPPSLAAVVTVRYSTETNPCRPELAASNPGCTPMRDDVDPGPGVWSLDLPTDPTTVRSLKFVFSPAYKLLANDNISFTFPMFAPIDAPIATSGVDGIAGNSDDTNVAWNTFAYTAVRVDDGSRLIAQPPRVGIEVQPVPPDRASLGDYVWHDVDQDGVQDEPDYRGVNGVSVQLWQPGVNGTPGDADDVLLGTTITRSDTAGDPGYYLFPALEPGSYFVRIIPPPSYEVTTQNGGAPNDDTKDSDADPSTGRTALVTLAAGDNNLSLDMGIYAPVVSIGNRVWYDTDNDGLDDDGGGAPGSGTGVSGVSVDLFLDVNGDGSLTGSEQQWIASQTTDATGFYLFDQQTHVSGVLTDSVPLYPGSYIVGIRPSNFTGAAPLVGYYSSGTTIDATGLVTDTSSLDPDYNGAPANPGVDRDENGDKQPATAAFYAGGVLSKAAYVRANEPLGEPESSGTAPTTPTPTPVPDTNSNLTVDFGFYTARIGSTVWLDDGAGGGTKNNGVQDGAEAGLAGATVRLYTADGATEIRVGPDGALGTADDATGGVTTVAGGTYQFTQLPQSTYLIRVTPPAGFASSKDVAGQTSAPNGNHDLDDNGVGSANGQASSASFALTPGSTGALNNNTVTTAVGRTLNPTIDFGFVRTYSLGNRVWADANNSGTLDGAEAGISGVTVRLYQSDGTTRAQTIAGVDVADATTDASGYYRFDNLLDGDYVVAVLSSNFSGPLSGFVSSTGAGQQANPNTDTETDDNGLDALVSGAVHSGVVTLGNGDGADEPATDTDGGAIAASEAPNDQSNRTVDFGFFEPLSLGNRVWDDANNNGVQDGGEIGLGGVTVNLYLDSNGDSTPDGAAIATMPTNATGHYLFTMLQPETYLVEIVPPAGYQSSTGYPNIAALDYEPAPDADTTPADQDDNGTLSGAVIRSAPVTLARSSEPTSEAATTGLVDPARDNNSNATVDFGVFKPLSLGNRVWEDVNNNGTIDGAEGASASIGTVTVRLYRDSDNDGNRDDANGVGGVTTADAIAVTTTDANGYYLFADLGADTYIVEAVTPNGYTSSTGKTLPTPYETNVPDPDTVAPGTDSDDNGAASGSVVRSQPVTLTLNGEPTGEGAMGGYTDPATDDSANYTVDFGFYQVLSLGNRVWLDANNNGVVDGLEAGIASVPVRLYRDSDNNGTPDDIDGTAGISTGDAIRSTTTSSSNGGGWYLFTGLDEDTYIVEIVPPSGYATSTGAQAITGPYEAAPDPDNSIDSDDNGELSGAVIRSKPVTLTLGGEPTGEGATPGISDTTADNRSNVTVDFGLFHTVSVGDLVFEDMDNNGTFTGAESTISGAIVELFLGDGTTPAFDVTGTPVASQTTNSSGLYKFTNLIPGDYVVKVTAPAGYRSTTGAGSEPAPDPDVDVQGTDKGTGPLNVAISLPVTLTSGGEPIAAADADDSDSNATVDFGFWKPVSLGNLVFQDNDDNGLYNPAVDDEIQNATVRLVLSDGTTRAKDVDGVDVADATTGADGLYAFSNLPPDAYRVIVTPPAGYRSSRDVANTPSPDSDANSDDNGVGTGTSATSNAITLQSQREPTIGADGDDTTGNTTLDFGFVLPVSLGNLVWDDVNNNGLRDAGEQPIQGATVTLYLSDGTTPATAFDGSALASQTTGPDGLYLFPSLRPGSYRATVQAPAGYRSSGDIANTPSPNSDVEDDDNGVGSNQSATSAAITLTRTAEPTADNDDTGADDAHTNTTLDFGFVRVYSLGNRVWFDPDNSRTLNGAEAGIAGVTLRLFKGDGVTQATTIAGATVADATTDATGFYNFDNLPPGDYIVEVQASNFTSALLGMTSSTDPASMPDPDNDVDSADDGLDTLVAGAVRSGVITLGNGDGADEPTGESDGLAAGASSAPDDQTNRTVDFGFFESVGVGNLVFEDVDNSGLYDAGTDRPLQGATVSLFLSDGTTVAKDITGAPVADQTTVADGLYSFINLPPGDYVVKVTAPAGYRSSTGGSTEPAGDPDNDTNNDDNGTGPLASVSSAAVTLVAGGEPNTAADGDGTNGNATVDFGFWQPVSLGNLVFQDNDDNGLYDPAVDDEIQNATVRLVLSDGTTRAKDVDGVDVADATTDATGQYAFTNLPPGTYRAIVTPPAGYRSSTDIATTTTPDLNDNQDDNGEGTGTTTTSRAIVLSSGDEPTTDGDGANGNTTLDFGFVLSVSLGNLVWDDVNNNGLRDVGEQPIQGATVTLYLSDGTTLATAFDGSALTSQTTGADGLYFFPSLRPGSYRVTVQAPAGYRSSGDIANTPSPNSDAEDDDNGVGVNQSATSAAITLVRTAEPMSDNDDTGADDAHTNTTLDFGFVRVYSLGNRVWFDPDNSGTLNGAEGGLPGVTLRLFKADGTTRATTIAGATVADATTDASGLYRFDDLPPGDYIVEVQASNFTSALLGMTSSTDPAVMPDPDNDVDSADDGLDTLVAGAVRSGVITLGNGDGADEPTSDTDGGALAIGEAPDDQSNRTVDFGFFRAVSVGNLVFEDVDNDGEYVVGTDRPLQGATVSLFLSDGVTVAKDITGASVTPMMTGATGAYSFTSLPPGDYIVAVTAPAGYRGSTGPLNDNEPGPDPDIVPGDNDDNGTGTQENASSAVVTLTSGGEPNAPADEDGTDGNTTVDFGFWQPVSLGNLVFEDRDGDSRYDALVDTPIQGATVSLFLADGVTVAKDVTGTDVAAQTTPASGLYSFTNLPPGSYVVKVDAPAGQSYTSSADLLTTGSPNGNVDSDDNGVGLGASAASNPITLTFGGEPNTPADEDGASGNTTVDFGFVRPMSLGNLVFLDRDNSASYDAGSDAPLAGVTVTLFKGDGTTPAVDVSGGLVAGQTTGADGLYLFTNLPPGSYVVKTAPPAGYRSSFEPAAGLVPDNDTDSDDNGEGRAATADSRAIALRLGDEPTGDGDGADSNRTLDFGFFIPVSLGNLVWEDVDGDALRDAGELPIQGAVVQLLNAGTLTQASDVDGTPVASQTTAADGLYGFTNLAPGSYVVRVTAPAGYRSSADIAATAVPNGNADDDDNGVGILNIAQSEPVALTSGDEPNAPADEDGTSGNTTIDFGFLRPASIGNRVWLDIDRDGIQDVGELDLPGVTVRLYTPGPNGTAGDGDDVLLGTDVTGASGDYLFDDLPSGQYYLTFDEPLGYRRSPIDATAEADDSDADPTTGRTALTTLDPAENDMTWDAGLHYTAGLGDRVWLDRNANGRQDAGEPGIPNVTVRLLDAAGTPLGPTVITNAGGFYLFTNLAPGDYRVGFDLPAGYEFSPRDQGDDIGDSDVDPADGTTVVTNIILDESDPSWDAGLYRLVSLGNLVWEDYNNNGLVDATESGVPGVTVELYRDSNSDGVPDATEIEDTQLTDASGLYLFGKLVPGQFIVVLPASNFAAGGPLEGYASSTGQYGPATGPFEPAPDPDADSDGGDDGSVQGGVILAQPVTLTTGDEPVTDTDSDTDSNLSVDFGVFQPASLGSVVWLDANRDGRRDLGEPGVAGVTVTLYNSADVAIATTTTDTNGGYIFLNLAPGSYRVGFSNLPTGYVFTTPDQGLDTFDSDADPLTGRTGLVTLIPGENNPTLYGGIHQPAPTAVTLDRFVARWQSGRVVIEWDTSSETNTWGFDLYRSATGRRADAERVTPSTVLARGRGVGGASYSWTDEDVQPGVTYTYWLLETEVGGGANEYGPATTAPTPSAGTHFVYLPIAGR